DPDDIALAGRLHDLPSATKADFDDDAVAGPQAQRRATLRRDDGATGEDRTTLLFVIDDAPAPGRRLPDAAKRPAVRAFIGVPGPERRRPLEQPVLARRPDLGPSFAARRETAIGHQRSLVTVIERARQVSRCTDTGQLRTERRSLV